MPSKTQKQHDFMQAVAHGFKPDKFKGPTLGVAKEFVVADKRTGNFGKPQSKPGLSPPKRK